MARPNYLVLTQDGRVSTRNFSFYTKVGSGTKKLFVNNGVFAPTNDEEEQIAIQKGWQRESSSNDILDDVQSNDLDLDDLFGDTEPDNIFDNVDELNNKEEDYKLKALLDLREKQLAVVLKLFPLPTCYADMKRANKEQLLMYMRVFKAILPARADIDKIVHYKNMRVDNLRTKVTRLYDDTLKPSFESCSLVSE